MSSRAQEYVAFDNELSSSNELRNKQHETLTDSFLRYQYAKEQGKLKPRPNTLDAIKQYIPLERQPALMRAYERASA